MQEKPDRTSQFAAQKILETVPWAMSQVRAEMRSCRGSELSVPQFRSLAFVNRNPGASLSDMADYLGLTLPSASKLVDGLVKHGFMLRSGSETDRRRLVLNLTERGHAAFNEILGCALAHLAQRLERLDDAQRQTLVDGLQVLKHVFQYE